VLKLLTPPYAEPVSLAEAKEHLKVEVSDDDALIRRLVKRVRRYVEGYTGKQLVTATWRLTLDAFPRLGGLELPRPPVPYVVSLDYTDPQGVTQTWDAANYVLEADEDSARLRLSWEAGLGGWGDGSGWPYGLWPATRWQPGAVTVTYVAGYATPFAADPATDLVTARGRTFAAGDVVRLSNSGGALPAPLEEDADYYVRDVAGPAFKLAASDGGAALDLTTAGTGTHFFGELPGPTLEAFLLILGAAYRNRDAATEGLDAAQVPQAAKDLLLMDWCGNYCPVG
jgi:hypothetical protein